MLKKVFSLIVVGVMVISLVGCGGQSVSSDGGEANSSTQNKSSKKKKVYTDDDFKDYYYGYVEDEVLHLMSEPIDGKTFKLKAGEELDTQVNKHNDNYNILVFDNDVLLNTGEDMFAGMTGNGYTIKNIEKLIIKGSARFMFYITNITADYAKMNTDYITDMHCMFGSSFKNEDVIDLNSWNVSNVTDMSEMFIACESLREIKIDNWDTRNVTEMYQMFMNCHNLQSIDLRKWNVSNVESMSDMFCDCYLLQKLKLDNWDTSNVRRMSGMFEACGNLQELFIDDWDVSNVNVMFHLFANCKKLKKLNIDNWKIKNEAQTRYMFYGCDESIIPSWYKE